MARTSGRKTSGTRTAKTSTRRDAPWDRENPKDDAHERLTPRAKAAAKRRAKRAGRPYPNLVDNMRAAGRRTSKKKAAKRSRKTAKTKR